MNEEYESWQEEEYYREVVGIMPSEPSEINDLGGSSEPIPDKPF